ncbi:hypothetical protein MZD04_gp314 [Pseudomonas phage Psa21]|uniref:Uncharacterized protein n=1 Tax=Pseudomonas phage Psa21 TaxID=2530023 RepID=A0A481W4V0_9CAUD|nr:hypothetical protein MZD04_gp314 [Pseudomonas phage Psa21]QBJ02840.1 hypothetical protein PSA21_314 [Pseudomonas phage Psa21]
MKKLMTMCVALLMGLVLAGATMAAMQVTVVKTHNLESK